MGGLLRSRTGIALAATVLIVGATLGAAIIVAHVTGSQNAIPAGAVPGVVQTPSSAACVSAVQARQVWSDVDAGVDALVLHPSLSGVDAIAAGTAAEQLRAYIQTALLDHGFSEREKSQLDDLSVVQAGCGAQPLTVRVTVTLLQDDYLAADGSVDHSDPGAGQISHLLQSYVRAGNGWKLVTIASLDATPGPGTV